MIYSTDKIDIEIVTVNPETGSTTVTLTKTNVECRVETVGRMVQLPSGKYEQIDYLVMLEDETIKIGDKVTVKSVMGVNLQNQKKIDVKEAFKAGGFMYCQQELYLGK